MRLKNIHGKLISKNVSKYLINWDKPCKSRPQWKVKQFLKPYWRGSVCYEEFPVYSTLLKVDLLNASYKIAIEVHGNQHENFNKHFHHNSRAAFLASIKRDHNKAMWLELNDFKLYIIYEYEVDNLSIGFFKEKLGLSLV